MQSFLHKSVKRILELKTPNELREVCIVVPSRRAVGFFKRELAASCKVAFLAPEVKSIDDFIIEFSGLRVLDNLSLIFELFEVYKIREPQLAFDQFITWAPTVLSDFDLIDQYLVAQPSSLFAYMTEAEALKRWNVKLDDNSEYHTVDGFFNRFSDLAFVYENFKARLLSRGMAYRGMAYRVFAEEVQKGKKELEVFNFFFFVGLNALSKAEIEVIDTLVHSKKASCFWDMDAYFMSGQHQAGNILRKYQNEGKFGVWNEAENLLKNKAKAINFYNSPNETFQVKAASELLRNTHAKSTVMVVPDEKMIPSVLFSLGEQDADFNISMGLGLSMSKWVRLLSLIFELQDFGFDPANKLSAHFVLALTKDVLLNAVPNNYIESIKALEAKVLEQNISFLDPIAIPDPLRPILMPWGSAREGLENIELIFYHFKARAEQDLDFVEKEFFYAFDKVLAQLKIQFIKFPGLSIKGIQLLLRELYKLEKVAFEGDPTAPLQIMSLLETRCIDFEQVIFLSFNEGIIPSSDKSTSFLPFEACLEFGIPVYKDQDAIMNYHFLRLLMRASKTEIIYSSGTHGTLGSKSEESRFSKQLRHNLIDGNSLIESKEVSLGFHESNRVEVDANITIEKTDSILQKIKEELGTNGLSPTSISQFIRCPLQYYFQRIAGIAPEKTLEQGIGFDVYGNWIHYALEVLANDYFKKDWITIDLLENAINNVDLVLDQVIEKHYKGYNVKTGWNFIFKQMATKSLKAYLNKRKSEGLPYRILKAEEKIRTTLDYEGLKVILKGTIDSIEEKEGTISLVDYKTGKAEPREVKSKNLADDFLSDKRDKLRQLLWYIYIYNSQSNTDKSISAEIKAFRNLDQEISIKPSVDLSVDVVEVGVKTILAQMLDKSAQIAQTQNRDFCKYCDYKTICNR